MLVMTSGERSFVMYTAGPSVLFPNSLEVLMNDGPFKYCPKCGKQTLKQGTQYGGEEEPKSLPDGSKDWLNQEFNIRWKYECQDPACDCSFYA